MLKIRRPLGEWRGVPPTGSGAATGTGAGVTGPCSKLGPGWSDVYPSSCSVPATKKYVNGAGVSSPTYFSGSVACYNCSTGTGAGAGASTTNPLLKCQTGWQSSVQKPDPTTACPGQAPGSFPAYQLSDETWCFQCNTSGTGAGTGAGAGTCPSGSVSDPSGCPGGAISSMQQIGNVICYQCQYGSQSDYDTAQSQLNTYLQNQQQISSLQQQQLQQQINNYNQAVLSRQQAYLNQLQQGGGGGGGYGGGGQPGVSQDQSAAAASAGVSPGANVQDSGAAYPAGTAPPPAVSWKGLGEVVLVLGAAALLINKFGGGGRSGGGGGGGARRREGRVHHIEKKESFDVEG